MAYASPGGPAATPYGAQPQVGFGGPAATPYGAQQQATTQLLGFNDPAPPIGAGYAAQQQTTSQLLGTSASAPAIGSGYGAQPIGGSYGAQQQSTAQLLGGTGVGAGFGAGYAGEQQTTANLLGSASAPAIGSSYGAQQQTTANLLGGGAGQQQTTSSLLGGGAAPAYASQQHATANLLGGTAAPAVSTGFASQQNATANLLGGASVPGAAGGYASQQAATANLLGGPSAKQAVDKGTLELHFIGELEVGLTFPGVGFNEGLFVDYQVHNSDQWIPIAKPLEGYAGQTQTAYADADGTFVFNHPLDIFFITTTLAEWPKLHLQVLRLDAAGRVDTVSYGSVSLPMVPGHVELNCRTWTVLGGSSVSRSRHTHSGDLGELTARMEVLEGKLPEERTQLVTKTSGTVVVTLDSIFRNAEEQGILLPGRSRAPQMMRTMPETWR